MLFFSRFGIWWCQSGIFKVIELKYRYKCATKYYYLCFKINFHCRATQYTIVCFELFSTHFCLLAAQAENCKSFSFNRMLSSTCCKSKYVVYNFSKFTIECSSLRSFWKWSRTTQNEFKVAGAHQASRNGRQTPSFARPGFKWKLDSHFQKTFCLIDSPQLSWKSDFHQWSSRRDPAKKKTI